MNDFNFFSYKTKFFNCEYYCLKPETLIPPIASSCLINNIVSGSNENYFNN